MKSSAVSACVFHPQYVALICSFEAVRLDYVPLLGSVAERSKALDLGSSLFGGVGSNPTAASEVFFFFFSLSMKGSE